MQQLEVSQALHILHRRQGDVGKAHNRIHKEGMLETVNKMRALEGDLCGKCANLRMLKLHGQNGDVVDLKCLANRLPVVLYECTPLGQTPTCPSFRPTHSP